MRASMPSAPGECRRARLALRPGRPLRRTGFRAVQLRLDRWLKPDDLVELEVSELGTSTKHIGDANTTARIEDLMPIAADAVEAAPAAADAGPQSSHSLR